MSTPAAVSARRLPAARRSAAARLGRPLAAALLALAAAGGCRERHDAASEARARESEEARRLAEQAGRLAREDAREQRHAERDHDSGRVSLNFGQGSDLTRAADPPLGPGDVRVASTDGMVVLSVIGDTVRVRLGDAAVARVRREMEDGAADDTAGIGGFVARTVKGAVAGAMGAATHFAVRVPAREVRDLRYEDGELRFRTGRSDKGNATSARFAPEDAERFMAAVRARQERPAGR